MTNTQVSEIKVAGIAACITCLLYSSGFLVIFTPFPLYFVATLYGKSVGKMATFLTFAVALVLYMFALPLMFNVVGDGSLKNLMFLVPGTGLAEFFSIRSAQCVGLLYLSYFLIFGWFFGEGILKKWSISRWFATSVGATFGFLVVTSLVLGLLGINIFGGLQTYMNEVLNEIIAAQETAGIESEKMFVIKSNAEHIVAFSITIIPAVVFLMGLIVASANYLLAKWIIKAPIKFAHLGDIKRYSVPHYFVWITIALGFIFFFERYVSHADVFRYISLNGLIAISGIYFLQGLLIVTFYMKNIRSRFFKALIYVTMFMFSQIVAPILVILGFTDLWIDFRRLIRKEINNKGVYHGSDSA